MKKSFLWVLTMGLLTNALWADTVQNQAFFKKVKGDVKVKIHQKWIKAQKDLTVIEGQQIMTQEDSTAVLGLFDGSELTISPNTEFTLTALQKPDANTKNIKFKLLWGKLDALVKKLVTAHSSFEIESGGVVCGVRGTEFSMFNNGATKPQVVVQVTTGSVYTVDSFGNHFVVQSGNQMKFLNGTKIGAGSFNPNNNNGVKKPVVNNVSSSTNAGSNSNSNGNSSNNPPANSGTTGSANANTTSANNPPPSNPPVSGPTGPTVGANSGPSLPTGPDPNTGAVGLAGSSLNDLNNQFQNNVLINNDNTTTAPAVQQAFQLNVYLTVGK